MFAPGRKAKCGRYCWADYLEDKNSFCGKVVFGYFIVNCSVAMMVIFWSTSRLRRLLESTDHLVTSFLVEVLSWASRLDFLVLVSSYLHCYFSDPGYIKPPSASFPLPQRHCKLCGEWKPARAHHCSKCSRCVFKMERHCHFINNCVGACNVKSYALFLCAFAFFVLLFMLSAPLGLTLLVARDEALSRSPLFLAQLALCSGLGLQACFFFSYVYELLEETFQNIVQNRTAIERRQNSFGANIRRGRAVSKVFGDCFWLFPLPMFHAGRNNLLEAVYAQRLGADREVPALAGVERFAL